jgi:AbrB family looped-hinge helix DNA binding protein
MISTVTQKGQVTIPKSIRIFLNIKPSDMIDFSIINDQVVIKPIKTLQDFRGCIPAKGKGDLKNERLQAKASVSKKIIEAME